jgi:ribosomal protein L6P/L9E
MSRVGLNPITIEEGVDVQIDNDKRLVVVSTMKGKLKSYSICIGC